MGANRVAEGKVNGELAESRPALERWFASRLGAQASAVTVRDVWRLSAGHSNETFAIEVSCVSSRRATAPGVRASNPSGG